MAKKRFELMDQFQYEPALMFNSTPRGDWTGWNGDEFWALAQFIQNKEPNGGPITDEINSLAGMDVGEEKEDVSKTHFFAKLMQNTEDMANSLTENPSFEEGNSDASSWVFWNPYSTASIQRVEGVAHTGNASVLFEGAEVAGQHQSIILESGLVATQVHYYTPLGSSTEGTIRLVMDVLDDSGRTLATHLTNPQPLSASSGEWAAIGLLEEVPPFIDGRKTSRVRVNARIDNAPDVQVYQDDFIVYQTDLPFEQSEEDRQTIITQNSSFEIGNDQTATSWGYWIPSPGTIERVLGTARSGNYSLLANQLQRGGPVQHFNSFEPGLTGVKAYVYATSESERGTAQIGLHVRNANNVILASYQSPIVKLSEHVGEWIALELLEDIPAQINGEDVVRAYVVLTIDRAVDTEVYIDDFTVYQIK